MTPYFFQALQYLYPQVVSMIGYKAYDAQGNEVQYDEVEVQKQADILYCKSMASSILISTDWTSIGDVGNPQMSNPYLINQADFISYRNQIRILAINPIENPTWPTPPTEQWSN